MAPRPIPGPSMDQIPPIDLLPKQGLVPAPGQGTFVPGQPLTSQGSSVVPTPPPGRYPSVRPIDESQE
jgi:hypothetical protein